MADWPHSPVHRFFEAGSYIITAGTYLKKHHFRSKSRLNYLCNEILTRTEENGFNLQAWAVFSNHYHIVGFTEQPENLKNMLRDLHSNTALKINEEDQVVGRQIWFQYWDTQLTNVRAYYARLRYVHENPVRHGLVQLSSQYPWCSAGWFQRKSSPVFQKTLASFGIERVKVHDDFCPEMEEVER